MISWKGQYFSSQREFYSENQRAYVPYRISLDSEKKSPTICVKMGGRTQSHLNVRLILWLVSLPVTLTKSLSWKPRVKYDRPGSNLDRIFGYDVTVNFLNSSLTYNQVCLHMIRYTNATGAGYFSKRTIHFPFVRVNACHGITRFGFNVWIQLFDHGCNVVWYQSCVKAFSLQLFVACCVVSRTIQQSIYKSIISGF